jgi:hypothetical protein
VDAVHLPVGHPEGDLCAIPLHLATTNFGEFFLCVVAGVVYADTAHAQGQPGRRLRVSGRGRAAKLLAPCQELLPHHGAVEV